MFMLIDLDDKELAGQETYWNGVQWSDSIFMVNGAVKVLYVSDSIDDLLRSIQKDYQEGKDDAIC